MNQAHLEFCSSPEWARLIEDELLSWVLDGWELGDDLLEVGPGPGLTTDVLRHWPNSPGCSSPAACWRARTGAGGRGR